MFAVRSRTFLWLAFLAGISACKKDDDPQPTNPNNPNNPGSNTVVVPCNDITANTTWQDVAPGDEVDYLVSCELVVSGNAVLTIAPGVKVAFEGTTSGIFTEDNAGLTAVGTAAKPIKFVGKNAVRGSWKGVFFGSNNPANQLAFATVLHAGGAESGVSNQKGAVQLTRSTSRGSITDCTIQESDGYGVYVAEEANLYQFARNTLTNNAGAPIGVSFLNLGKLDAASNYKDGNGLPYIDEYNSEVYSGEELEQNMTLNKLNVPYRISGRVYLKAELKLLPGVVIEFNPAGELTTRGFLFELTGAINAVGTSAEHIVLRGVQSAQGAWKGIAIVTNSPNNKLVYCDISDGGAGELYGPGNGVKGNLGVGLYNSSPTRVTIQNCSFKNSLGYGYFRKNDPNVVITASGNTFANNAQGDIGTF